MLSRTLGSTGWKAVAVSLLFSIAACSSTASNEPVAEPRPDDVEAQVERITSSLSRATRTDGEEPEQTNLVDLLEQHGVPGVSVAVFKDGEILWSRGFGLADAETKQTVTADTLFQAASISKPVAGLAALRLVEEGVLELDRDVNDYLETWKVPPGKQSSDNPVTIRGLLTHSAGMTVHGFPGYAVSAEVPTVV